MIPWRRKWQPTPVFLRGKPHGQRAWQVTVHGISRVRHGLATRPSPEREQVLTKQEILLGRGAGWRAAGRGSPGELPLLLGSQAQLLLWLGWVSELSLADRSDSGSSLVLHTLLNQARCQQEGFREVVGHVVSPSDLSRILWLVVSCIPYQHLLS